MFEGAVAGILNRLLGKYVQDLDTENLNVGIFSGNVNLSDLKLKPEALYELDLPIDVKIGTIGRINFQIPWSGLYSQPVVVHIEDVLVLVGPAISNTHFDPDREKRLTRAAKRKILQDLEAESEILKGPQNFFEQLFTAIVNNLQIYVRNVHVRYEDSISSKDGPLACGFCLQSLSIETTNSKWKPSVTPVNASTVYQMMRVESLSLYWNPTATVLDDAETAHITPMQYYNWKHYMLTGLDKFSMHHEEFEFLLKPVTCKVKVLINRSGESRVPRLLLDTVLQDSALQLSRRQYLSIDNLLNSFTRIKLNRKYRHLHPGTPLTKDVKKWWHYAYNVVLEQRVRPYTWQAIKKHRQNYNVYKQTYKSTLRSPNDTELKLDLQKCEDSLPIVSVVIAREQAKFELLSHEPDRIEVVTTERDWWKPNLGGGVGVESPTMELCVKTERCRSLWSHLSSPERKRVYELIGYVEGTHKDRSKQYIEHKINLTLANFSLSLMNRNKEILVVTLTQFLASLETRPSAKAYKLSARAESIVVEGTSSDGDLVPLLSSERGSSISPNLLAVDLEKNPSNFEADYGLCCVLEPVELLYVEHSFTELLAFFQTRGVGSVEAEPWGAWGALGAWGAWGARSVWDAWGPGRAGSGRRAPLHVQLDARAPCLLLPDSGAHHKSGKVLIVDISRIMIKSDLQPSNLALEDATCMELEEKLYDRYHAECSCQVLFCEWSDAWRERRKLADSALHLVPKLKAQVVFSNSIKKEYKLLPRYKLNVSLSNFKLNLSDRIIQMLLDFADSFPVPVPNTVPVSFLDSGDYAVGCEDPELMIDRVIGDPGYKELVGLRQKIVTAYLTRTKAEDSTFDKEAAKSSFQASEAVFLSSEHSDEDLEVFARAVDLPGFDDNVSESNTINTLFRFIVGEVMIKLCRHNEGCDAPYLEASVWGVRCDAALLRHGPALQLSAARALVLHVPTALQLLHAPNDLLDLIYRKVRADCPEFRSQFHSVEQALVGDLGPLAVLLHADALRDLISYLQSICHMIQARHSFDIKSAVVPRAKKLWNYLMKPEEDPPVPSGATKFSYSVRASSIALRVMVAEWSLVEVRLAGLESDCVFRANDRMIFRLSLTELHLDHLSEATLYPKLVWPDCESVVEVKYVRAAPRYYGGASLKAHGQLRVRVGRLHVVLFCSVLQHLQHFLEPLAAGGAAQSAWVRGGRAARDWARRLRTWPARISLAIQINAPVLLLPQKPSSPNLLVLNMGDLLVENFFKQVKEDVTSPVQSPVVDNILIKLTNLTLARAVMTLAGTLEVQEAIVEPVCVRMEVKRCVAYGAGGAARRDVLACDADVRADALLLNVGQKDLATLLAVWTDNLSEGMYIGNLIPSSPDENQQSDASVKKLQAFFSQGEPIRKESVLRFTLEGIELKLFLDMDEVLSSPVRDLNQGLAKMTVGDILLQMDWFSDTSTELKASLQSLSVEDIRPDPTIVIRKIFQSQGVGGSGGGIEVRRPALVELEARGRGALSADLRVDRSRLNLALPFLLQLARALLLAVPGEKSMEGGVVNHGYVGDSHPSKSGNNNRPNRIPSSSDSTSGYYSSATSVSEETPGLSISIQFRQPEVLFFTDSTKSEGHALLLRTELLIDYSYHANTESLVISLAGLQMMSKLQSKLKNLPPQMVLKPCDVEFSRIFKNVEEGVKIKLSVSDIEVHIAATTIHTVIDIIEEINTELLIPEEKELFNFSTYNPRSDKDEELWTPHKLSPHAGQIPGNCAPPPGYTGSFTLVVPSARILFEIEGAVRVPLFVVKVTGEVSLQDWSQQVQGSASLTLQAWCYNERLSTWEPVVEPLVEDENVFKPWEITATIFQGKAYPMLSQTTKVNQEPDVDVSILEKSKTKKKRFESETSTDEGDTDTEMTFIRNPFGNERQYKMDFNTANLAFFKALDNLDESDSDEGLKDEMSAAVAELFTDDSSADELSDDDNSSAPEQSEVEDGSDREDKSSAENSKEIKEGEPKTVTVQEPVSDGECDGEGAGEGAAGYSECVCVCVSANGPLRVCATRAGAACARAFFAALQPLAPHALLAPVSPLTLLNDIGPGSTVHLKSRTETDLAGNDTVIAIADYYVDTSRPSTPGDSVADLLEDEKERIPEMTDITDEWDCFEGGFPWSGHVPPAAAWSPPAPRPARSGPDRTLTIKLHDMDELTIPCPARTSSKLHVLHPSKNSTRYYVVVERSSDYTTTKIVVRSPLQLRNETSYALEVWYRTAELESAGVTVGVGADVGNPFAGLARLAVVPSHDTYNVPLYVAYHCRLYLLPSNFEGYQTASQGIWWKELAGGSGEAGAARDMVCPARADGDPNIFAIRILATEGIQSRRWSRSIPNYLVRVVPPLVVYNQLARGVCARAGAWSVRAEAGERAACYVLDVRRALTVHLEVAHRNLVWAGEFTLTPDMREKHVVLCAEGEGEGEGDSEGEGQLGVWVRVERDHSVQMFLHAPYWVSNKTGLPLQIKGSGGGAVYSVGTEAVSWGGARALRVRAHGSAWCRAAPCARVPGLLVCPHTERRTHYRILTNVTLSELCPQLTKILTLLPYFVVMNDTKRHLRFMEENEAADLWMDLAPQQCVPFWPQTDSMAMHCKYRNSALVSQHFPIAKTHFTVLRMDKGSAICVEVTGGTERPFTITFRPCTAGDAPVRVDNLCDDLFLKLHQEDSGQVALLSPYQSLLYTWDDPVKERTLLWNIYNNKGKGFVADFGQDGYGEEKVSFHSVKQSTLVATSSVTSKLSSTLKRLTPKSPEPFSSSSDDSDSTEIPETPLKTKKTRKDKVIVYWTSYMDGHQRVFALAQDERIAYHYRKRIYSERSNFEVYLSLPELSLSVCLEDDSGVKELAYVSLTDSAPRWEVNFGRKWRQLSTELSAWIEDKYQTEHKKYQLKEHIHIDLEKMQMTKPFFSELRRTYNPAMWMQLRKSDTYTYCHLKLHRLQIDNQIDDAVFPSVLHPAAVPLKPKDQKPCIEIVTLKQCRPEFNQDVYKYLKVLVQEYCVNLDRGFVNYLFDILNHWKVEEKPAVRLRADLALVHMPLPLVATKSQGGKSSVILEYVHLSPIKMMLSLSSRGYVDNMTSPRRVRFMKENQPKFFNSDLLEYIFNSWGSSICDVKDVVFRMSYLELRNAEISTSSLLDSATRHYWIQLMQQFYVLVLGQSILGNPYSPYGDFSKDMKQYYEPYLGSMCECGAEEASQRARVMVGRRVCGLNAPYTDTPNVIAPNKKLVEESWLGNDIPAAARAATRASPASVALAFTALIASPAADVSLSRLSRLARRARGARGAGLRARLPRHCPILEGVSPYSAHCALGRQLLARLSRGHYADAGYVAHAHLAPRASHALLITTRHIFLVVGGAGARWHIEWAVKIHELLEPPSPRPGRLVLVVKQDELVNYFPSDERVVEIPDPEVLSWLCSKIEEALIIASEDKRCPADS